ncbi:MAG: diaminopimelate epimerase [Candidatus Zixiibacteriota bacterium]|nr:MAG: diaminopimelate epimerase [candidate division Zixibacteria bacterium]
MKIKFTKMQALGNDYLYVDCFKQRLAGVNLSRLAEEICDRHFGVGADGLILVSPGRTHRFRMIFYNPDGTEAEMCGNGIRCFARFVYDTGLSRARKQSIETKAGIIRTEIVEAADDDFLIRADIGKPILDRKKIPVKGRGRFCIGERLKLKRGSVKITSISLGNPHTVILVKEFNPRWREIGRMVENHSAFPRRTNVEFAKVLSPNRIGLKIWERGAGETLASGTGASAATVAGVLAQKLNRRVTALFDRGKLLIEWSEKDDHLYMTGPATSVFSGIYDYRAR